MSEFTENLVSLAFMFFGLYFFVKTFEDLDRRADSDRRKDDTQEDIRYARLLNEAREFGYKGSKLQKQTPEPPEKTTDKK